MFSAGLMFRECLPFSVVLWRSTESGAYVPVFRGRGIIRMVDPCFSSTGLCFGQFVPTKRSRNLAPNINGAASFSHTIKSMFTRTAPSGSGNLTVPFMSRGLLFASHISGSGPLLLGSFKVILTTVQRVKSMDRGRWLWWLVYFIQRVIRFGPMSAYTLSFR